jgi:hypothetical protein
MLNICSVPVETELSSTIALDTVLVKTSIRAWSEDGRSHNVSEVAPETTGVS